MEKGLKLLYTLFWNGNLWGSKAPTTEDFEQAIAQGYMFPAVPVGTHDETLCKLKSLVETISPKDIANGFVYSLSTRELQYRSALGSYYYGLSIPHHSHQGSHTCYFCDWREIKGGGTREGELSEYNTFNFERYKWGGVRHTNPEYALFDLEQFLRLPKVTPTQEDWDILKAILHSMDELPPDKKAGAYQGWITKKKLLRSNKGEVEVLLNILGICGVLSSPHAPCYCDAFPDVWKRMPEENTNDYAYPVNRWRVSDGVNAERFRKVFGFEYGSLL